jgi:hypothetical protein
MFHLKKFHSNFSNEELFENLNVSFFVDHIARVHHVEYKVQSRLVESNEQAQ